jgi:hypothetical protein
LLYAYRYHNDICSWVNDDCAADHYDEQSNNYNIHVWRFDDDSRANKHYDVSDMILYICLV